MLNLNENLLFNHVEEYLRDSLKEYDESIQECARKALEIAASESDVIKIEFELNKYIKDLSNKNK